MNTFLTKTLTMACAVLILIGCQSRPLDVYHEQSLSFDEGRYSTVKLVHEQKYKGSDSESFINNGIKKVMREKGYQIVEENPDLIVRYSISTKEGQRLEFDDPNSGHPPHMEAVFKARILINVIETSSGNVVWKAATTRDLTGVDTSKYNQEKANAGTQALFADFPDR